MMHRPWVANTLLLLLFLAGDLTGLLPYLEQGGMAVAVFLFKNSSNLHANYLESLPVRWSLYGSIWLVSIAILPRLSSPGARRTILLLTGGLPLGALLSLHLWQEWLPVVGPLLLVLVLAGQGILPVFTPPLPPPEEPRRLGFYQIGPMLGRGSMSTVYQGRDLRNQQEVAIKLFAPPHDPTSLPLAAGKDRFLQAATLARRLHHPHIVRILDQGEEGNDVYVVMERLTGHPLERYTHPAPETPLLPVSLVILIVARVAMALDHAHRRQVIHRDIKPANILFDPVTGQVTLMDFGSACRLSDEKTAPPQTGQTRRIIGTPYYLSPEQVLGKPVDGRSDLFSLGVLFYQLLTGCLPFPAREMSTLLLQISRTPPVDLRSIRPELPVGLCAIVEKSLQKNVADRYQTGRSLTTDLLHLVKHQVESAQGIACPTMQKKLDLATRSRIVVPD